MPRCDWPIDRERLTGYFSAGQIYFDATHSFGDACLGFMVERGAGEIILWEGAGYALKNFEISLDAVFISNVCAKSQHIIRKFVRELYDKILINTFNDK